MLTLPVLQLGWSKDAKCVASSQVMIYIDNEDAKFALIRGYSDSFAISLICHLVVQQLDDHCVLFHPLQIYQIFLLERSDPDT